MPGEHLLIRRPLQERLLIYIFISILFFAVFGTGGLLGICIASTKKYFSRVFLYTLSLFGVVWAIVLYMTGSYAQTLSYWLVYTLPFAGMAQFVLTLLLWLHEWYLVLPTWDASVHSREKFYERQHEQRVQQYLQASPVYQSDLELGLVVQEDIRSRPLPGISVLDHLVWFDQTLLNQHLLLIGAPGSGKSEAIKKVISEVLSKTDRDVFIVDGKGEVAFTHHLAQLFHYHRQVDIPHFHMGTSLHGDAYNGFAGSDEAIKQRLTAMFNIEQQMGDGEFYANVNRSILNLICLSPEGAPRSLEELDERLSLSWLKYCYRSDPIKSRAISRYEPWFDGLRVRADSLIWDFHSYLSPSGFSLEHTQGAIFSLRTAAMGDTSRRFLNFLIEDFKDWVGKRQKRPALLVIDEFGQFENQSIIALIELARSAKLGILLATQDLSTVRERHIRERLLSSIQTKILMKTDTPEVIGELAGTYTTPHLTYQTNDVDLTGLGSIRLEEARKVDLNTVRRFPPGRAYLIRSGEGMIVQFRQVADVAS